MTIGLKEVGCPEGENPTESEILYEEVKILEAKGFGETESCKALRRKLNQIWIKEKNAEKPKEDKKKETDKQPTKQLTNEDLKKMKGIYEKIILILKKYCDLDEKNYNIVALWILGTYLHKSFPTYPYLFFNAMKSSGKTRLLKLISFLSKNGDGKLVGSLSESVLFRTASMKTFCIDEFEHIGSKEKQALRELLNSAYKKGLTIERAKKVKNQFEEGYSIESFDVYCPICMANIWGMEEVLADRCIILTLEKSSKKEITRLLELFERDLAVLGIKSELNELFGVVSGVVVTQIYEIIFCWNEYIINYTNNTHNIHNTNYTNYNLFEKIEKTEIDGRHLELFFPLFILADYCGVLDEIIDNSSKIIKEKKNEDIIESKDVALIDFLSKYEETSNFLSVNDLTRQFRDFLGEEDDKNKNKEDKWLNSKWFGRAIKRLVFIIEKRRIGRGIEVVINFKKAQEKVKMFIERIPEPKILAPILPIKVEKIE